MLNFPVSVFFSIFLAHALPYLIIVEEMFSPPGALVGAGHDDVRVVPYFVHPDSRRGVLVYMPAPRCKHGAGGGDSGRSRLLTRPLLDRLCVCERGVLAGYTDQIPIVPLAPKSSIIGSRVYPNFAQPELRRRRDAAPPVRLGRS